MAKIWRNGRELGRLDDIKVKEIDGKPPCETPKEKPAAKRFRLERLRLKLEKARAHAATKAAHVYKLRIAHLILLAGIFFAALGGVKYLTTEQISVTKELFSLQGVSVEVMARPKKSSTIEMHRLQLEVGPRSYKRIQRLKELTESSKYAEVISDALCLYEAFVDNQLAGNEVFARDKDGNEIPYRITF